MEAIDATDVARGLYRVTQRVPVAPDATRLTLLLPQWIPGAHAPRGRSEQVADLRFFAGDKLLTTPNPSVDRDSAMLATLGLTPRVSSVSSQATASSCSSPSNPAGTSCCDGQGQAH